MGEALGVCHVADVSGKSSVVSHHADGGAELIDQKLKNYLLQAFGTPELNSISERMFRILGEMTLAMLTDSRLPNSFWWDAYVYACNITCMMPTHSCRGWMSPAECVPSGRVPNLSRLRRWGARHIYVLVPKADRRKDCEDKAMLGYYIGYPKTKVRYPVLLGDTVVTTVHVLLDESISERSAEYFRKLDEATVKCNTEGKLVSDFVWLGGSAPYLWMVNSSIRPLGWL